jgi:hypothetical protein
LLRHAQVAAQNVVPQDFGPNVSRRAGGKILRAHDRVAAINEKTAIAGHTPGVDLAAPVALLPHDDVSTYSVVVSGSRDHKELMLTLLD